MNDRQIFQPKKRTIMMTMRVSVVALLLLVTGWAFAQEKAEMPGYINLDVKGKDTQFGDSTYYAYFITVAQTKKSDVDKLLEGQMKEKGGSKERFKGNATMHTQVRMSDIHDAGLTLLHKVDDIRKTDNVEVAVAFLVDGYKAVSPDRFPQKDKKAKEVMHDFAVKLNKGAFQVKVDEAQKELEGLEKDLEKAEKEQQKLEEDIQKADKDRVKAKEDEAKVDQKRLQAEYELKQFDAMVSPSAKDMKKKAKAQKDLEKLAKDKDKVTKAVFKAESDKQQAEAALPAAKSEVERLKKAVNAQKEKVKSLQAQLESIK